MNYDGLLPVFSIVTQGKNAEINVARQIGFIKGSVVVIDRGYLDIKWLNKLDSSGCFYVIREKTNMAFELISNHPVAGDVLSDQRSSLKLFP